MTCIRQSRSDSGLGFQVKGINNFQSFPARSEAECWLFPIRLFVLSIFEGEKSQKTKGNHAVGGFSPKWAEIFLTSRNPPYGLFKKSVGSPLCESPWGKIRSSWILILACENAKSRCENAKSRVGVSDFAFSHNRALESLILHSHMEGYKSETLPRDAHSWMQNATSPPLFSCGLSVTACGCSMQG